MAAPAIIGIPQVKEIFAANTAAATSSVTITVTNTTSGGGYGHELHLFYRTGGAKTLSSVTDSQGNTWTVNGTTTISGAQAIGHARCVLKKQLVGGTDTITLNWSGATSAVASIWVEEAYGVIAGGTTDQTNTKSASQQNATIATGALARPQELVWAVWFTSVGTSFTLDQTPAETAQLNASGNRSFLEFTRSISTATFNMTGTFNASVAFIAAVYTYKINTSGIMAVM